MTIICDTSPVQYLHQLGLLDLLPKLAKDVLIPSAVVSELEQGMAQGVDLPSVCDLGWATVREPVSKAALPLVFDLGAGETAALALGIELPEAVVVLDDGLARRAAVALDLRFTGTLGILLDAKRATLVPAIGPLMERLESLRFRVAPDTRDMVLRKAGELD